MRRPPNREERDERDLEIARVLGAGLRAIRQRTTGTQDRWAERTGMSQSYLSSAERGEHGWDSVVTIGRAVRAAGVEPIELLRSAVAEADLPPGERDLLALWATAEPAVKHAVLTLLRARTTASNT